MARETSRPLFLVLDGPGPYKLLKEYMAMFDEHRKMIVELTLLPTEDGANWIGFDESFRIQFHASLIGPTSKTGHPWSKPSNVRLLGQFRMSNPVLNVHLPVQFADELVKWQWEVVLGSDRSGFVARLNSPLLNEWAL